MLMTDYKKTRREICYMATDTSIYELPVAVAETVTELAQMLGTTANAISVNMMRNYGYLNSKIFGHVKIYKIKTGEIKE